MAEGKANSVEGFSQTRKIVSASGQPSPSLYTGGTPWLVRHAWFGYLLFVFGAIGFFVTAWQVKTNGPLMQRDMPIAQALGAWARAQPYWLFLMMGGLSGLGRDGVGLILLTLGVTWIKYEMRRELGWLLLGTPSGELLYQMAHDLVPRHCPPYQIVGEVINNSFPSGHATASILLGWLILYLLIPRIRSRFWRVFWSVVLIGVLVAVFLSRMYLGLHYLTDIVAGVFIGLSWGGLIYTILEQYYWPKHKKELGQA